MAHGELGYTTAINAIHLIRKYTYASVLAKREGLSAILDEFTSETIPESLGDRVISFKERHAVTDRRLVGSERAINKETLIQFQNFDVPFDVTKDNVRKMIHKREVAKRAFTRISISEPGYLKPIKSSFEALFYRSPSSPQFIVGIGVMHVLNGTVLDELESQQLLEDVTQSWQHMEEIALEERAYFQSVVETVFHGEDIPGA
jgi:hypothetical protein